MRRRKKKRSLAMSKYIVCSDPHLNLNRRFEDTLDALRQIHELATENDVDEVWVLGDVYQNRRPHSKEKAEFEKWVYKLYHNKINIVILKGNHDTYPDGTHSFSEFTELRVDGVTILDNPSTYRGFFLGHLLLSEARLGPTDYQSPNCTSTEKLIAKYPDCIAYLLGDVHKAQTIQEDPLIIYAGSINRVDFGERNDEKSVLLIETYSEAFKCKRIALESRPMIQIDFQAAEPFGIDMRCIRGSIVKIVFHGTTEEIQTNINEARLREDLKEAKELIIQYDVIKESIARDERVNENITPQQALELYLEKLDLTPEEKAAIVELSQKVMEDATA